MKGLNPKQNRTIPPLRYDIVKNLNYPFRKSYQVTARIVNYCEKNKKRLSELSHEELKKIDPNIKEDVIKVFNLKNSVNSKKSYVSVSSTNPCFNKYY